MAQSQKDAGAIALCCKLPQTDPDESVLSSCIREALLQDYGAEWMKSTTDDRRRLHIARNALAAAMNQQGVALEQIFQLQLEYWMLLKRFVRRLDEKQALAILYGFRWKNLHNENISTIRDIRMELFLVTYNSAVLHTQLASKMIRAAVNGGHIDLSSEQLQHIASHYRRAETLLSKAVCAPWSTLLRQRGNAFGDAVASVQDLSHTQLEQYSKLCNALASFWDCCSLSDEDHQQCARGFLSASHHLAEAVDSKLPLLSVKTNSILQALAAQAQLCSDLHAYEYLLLFNSDDERLQQAYKQRIRSIHRSMNVGSSPLAVHVPFFLTASFVMQHLQDKLRSSGGSEERGGGGAAQPQHPELGAHPVRREPLKLQQQTEMERLSLESKAFLWMALESSRQQQLAIYFAWYQHKLQGADACVKKALQKSADILAACYYPWLLLELDPARFAALEKDSQQDTSIEHLVNSVIPSLLRDTTTCISSNGAQLAAFKTALDELSTTDSTIADIYQELKDAGCQAENLAKNNHRSFTSLKSSLAACSLSSFPGELDSRKLQAYEDALLFLQRSLVALKKGAAAMILSDQQTPPSAKWLVTQHSRCDSHYEQVLNAAGALKKAWKKIMEDKTSIPVRRTQLRCTAIRVERDARDVYNYYSHWSSFVNDLSIHNVYYEAPSMWRRTP